MSRILRFILVAARGVCAGGHRRGDRQRRELHRQLLLRRRRQRLLRLAAGDLGAWIWRPGRVTNDLCVSDTQGDGRSSVGVYCPAGEPGKKVRFWNHSAPATRLARRSTAFARTLSTAFRSASGSGPARREPRGDRVRPGDGGAAVARPTTSA